FTMRSSGCKGQGYETAMEACEEVHAREAGPLAVRREQHVRLLRLHPPAPEGGRELGEGEVAVEPVLVPSEAFEADDADGPRAEPALAREARDDGGRRMALQPFEVERPAESHERPCAACPETEAGELRRREAAEVRGRR